MVLVSCQGEEAESKLEEQTKKEIEYREFYGVRMNAHQTGYENNAPADLDDDGVAALAAVVVHYRVPLRYEDGTLFIPASEFEDMNYLYNLTIKSEDTTWLKQHIFAD